MAPDLQPIQKKLSVIQELMKQAETEPFISIQLMQEIISEANVAFSKMYAEIDRSSKRIKDLEDKIIMMETR